MSTSTFEMELEHVKQIGCPSCGADHGAFYTEYDSDLDECPRLIACDSCGFPIWKDDDWAPELYKIGV